MTLPLVVLAALSVVAGFVVIPDVARAIGLPGGFGELVYTTGGQAEAYHFNGELALAGTLAAVLGILFAWWLVADLRRPQRLAAAMPGPYHLVRNKFYFDEMYQWLIDRVVLVVAYGVAWFDRHLINDTGVDGTSNLLNYFGFRLKFAQTGKLPNYALAIVVGVIALAVIAFSART
jgi:NADH-quinone oxidoreductase subunit L